MVFRERSETMRCLWTHDARRQGRLVVRGAEPRGRGWGLVVMGFAALYAILRFEFASGSARG